MRIVVQVTCWILAASVPVLASAQEPELVRVGARHVEVVRMGTGSPTVLLESGASMDWQVWRGVMQALSEHSRVVAYSRAGLGQSDPSDDDSPVARVRELHELLHALGETNPIVFVGWSYGGLLGRLYTSTHPNRIAGLVLIDATHERQFARWQPVLPFFPLVEEFARLVSTFPEAERADLDHVLEIQRREHVPGMQPLPNVPLAVITAMKPCPPEREPVCRDPQALLVTRELHAEWFNRSAAGIHIVSDRTGHVVMADEPELVIQAVRHVLHRVRDSRH